MVSFLVFLLTLEQVASFLDCGEFITCDYKLQIAHPPGALLYTLKGRLFAALAGSDVTNVVFYVNVLSVVCSVFTIVFLFKNRNLIFRKTKFYVLIIYSLSAF